jgi:phosphate transport system substrate-binding protein
MQTSLARFVATLPVFALATASALLLAASPLQSNEKADLSKLKGAIKIDGSSTVYPITEAVAEEFNKVAGKVRVTVGISGTGGGFKRFAAGEIDISDASRPIKKAETETAAKSKVEFVELPIAYDGLTIVVHPKNTWCTTLTVEEVTKIYSASGGIKTWKDINPAWPDKAIKVYSPGTDSGTFDYFKEVTVGKDGSIRSDISVSEDDNVLVRGVTGDENSIGFFGCAYYFENKDKLKSVAINGGKGPVSPTTESIENGTYVPFSRPLFIYVNKASAEKPEMAAFVSFYLENAPELVAEVGYVRLPESISAKVATNWAKRRLGTQFTNAAGETVTGPLAQVYE